ncbi:MAG: hypothetical protein HY445_02840 [Candidatus Niyogibacteria bacterium]|nr:hypothetical protein [Candidatus Niyogibacteria bacterium]
MQKQRTKQKGGGDDGRNEVEVEVVTGTGGKAKIKIKKGTTLSQLIRYKLKHKLEANQTVERNRHVIEHKDGELLEDPVLEENDLIIIRTEIVGGPNIVLS